MHLVMKREGKRVALSPAHSFYDSTPLDIASLLLGEDVYAQWCTYPSTEQRWSVAAKMLRKASTFSWNEEKEASVCGPTHWWYRHRHALIFPLRSLMRAGCRGEMVRGMTVCKPLPYSAVTSSSPVHSFRHRAMHWKSKWTWCKCVALLPPMQLIAVICVRRAVHSIIVHLDFILICCGCQCLFINNYTSFLLVLLSSSPISILVQSVAGACTFNTWPSLAVIKYVHVPV